MRHGRDILDEHRLHLAPDAQGAGQRAAVGRDDGRFAGGIDLRQTQRIDGAQHLDEILETVARPRVAVRLESQDQAASREGTAGSGQRGGHFDRVVAVVIDQREAATARQGHLAITLEAATDPLELGQGLDDGFVGYLHLGGHGDGGQGVEHVVHARRVEHDGQAARRAVDPDAGEAHAAIFGHHILGVEVVFLRQAVGDGLLRHARQDVADIGIIAAHHGDAVERQAVEKIDEGRLQALEVVAVGFHVVGVDIGDHRNDRRQEQKRGIRLVGLGHQEVAAAQSGIGAGGVQATTNDEGRIDTAFGQDTGHQAGRRRLAVRAGDGDAAFQAHQLGQHLGARHDRDLLLSGGDHFRVVGLDGGGHDQRVRAGNIRGGMADHHLDAFAFEAAGRRAGRYIRAADVEVEVGEHFGNAAHARTADADEVDVLDLVFHLAISVQSCATASAASGLARLRAFSAISSNWLRE